MSRQRFLSGACRILLLGAELCALWACREGSTPVGPRAGYEPVAPRDWTEARLNVELVYGALMEYSILKQEPPLDMQDFLSSPTFFGKPLAELRNPFLNRPIRIGEDVGEIGDIRIHYGRNKSGVAMGNFYVKVLTPEPVPLSAIPLIGRTLEWTNKYGFKTVHYDARRLGGFVDSKTLSGYKSMHDRAGFSVADLAARNFQTLFFHYIETFTKAWGRIPRSPGELMNYVDPYGVIDWRNPYDASRPICWSPTDKPKPTCLVLVKTGTAFAYDEKGVWLEDRLSNRQGDPPGQPEVAKS